MVPLNIATRKAICCIKSQGRNYSGLGSMQRNQCRTRSGQSKGHCHLLSTIPCSLFDWAMCANRLSHSSSCMNSSLFLLLLHLPRFKQSYITIDLVLSSYL